MKKLLFKELRTLRPYIYLGLFLALLDVMYSFLISFPDRHNIITLLNGHLNGSIEYDLFYLFFTFSMALMLIPREYDDKTIEFLYSLPVSKAKIYFSKYIAAVLVISTYPFIELSSFIPLHAIGYSSTDPSFHLDTLSGIFFLHMILIIVLQAICFFLSFFRRFAWIIIGIIFWFYQRIISTLPDLKILNPLELISIEIYKEAIAYPWTLISLQILFGVSFLVLGFLIFSARWSIFAEGFQNLKKKNWGKIILVTGTISSIIVIIILISNEMEEESKGQNYSENKITYTIWNTSTAQTKYFRFLYPTNIEKQALQLISKSDSLYSLVKHFFKADIKARIYVDMTREYEHYAGTANWLTINMDVPEYKQLPSLMSTFVHELTHVYIDVLSDKRMMESFNSTRFFHEGLASYISYKHFKKLKDYDGFRFVSTVVYSRKDFNLDLIMDSYELTSEHDEGLVYPFGEKFINALVNKYGINAPVKIIESFSDSTLNRILKGNLLWTEVFNNCGYSLEGVTSVFYNLLEKDIQYFSPKHKEFSSLKCKVEIDSNWITITPTKWEIPEGWDLTCRFRTDKDTNKDEYSDFFKLDNQFKKDLGVLNDEGIDYQIGYQNNFTGRIIYQPWVRIWL